MAPKPSGGVAKDTLGSGILSSLLGLTEVAFDLVIGASESLAKADPGDLTVVWIGCGLSLTIGLGQIAAGVLALAGRRDYLAWRRPVNEGDAQ